MSVTCKIPEKVWNISSINLNRKKSKHNGKNNGAFGKSKINRKNEQN